MLKRVVLLHGLARTARSMVPVERSLHNRGYQVTNLGYESTSAHIDSLAADIARRLPADPILNFVTHSMGGIILRTMVARGYLALDRVGRVVMIGPPNGGSELADILPAIPGIGYLFRRTMGPAGLELNTGPTGVPANLPPVPFELGVIAGSWSWNPLFSALLQEPSDGTVRIARTKVAGMRDFVIVREWHSILMRNRVVLEHVHTFLADGAFRVQS